MNEPTFFAAFAALFGILALYLLRIDRRAARLEQQLSNAAATVKNPDETESS